jgi:hypothetical protein
MQRKADSSVENCNHVGRQSTGRMGRRMTACPSPGSSLTPLGAQTSLQLGICIADSRVSIHRKSCLGPVLVEAMCCGGSEPGMESHHGSRTGDEAQG